MQSVCTTTFYFHIFAHKASTCALKYYIIPCAMCLWILIVVHFLSDRRAQFCCSFIYPVHELHCD